MSDILFNTIEQLRPALRAGELEDCENTVVEKIRQLARSPFDAALEMNISNDPVNAAKTLDGFFELEARQMTIAAAYTEMNGFDINPRLWFCDFFAYASYGGHDDYDWLSGSQSSDSPHYVIRGMETLQSVYASDASREKSFHDAKSMSSLLVVIKFQQFMKKAATQMKLLHFPFLVTAHDFDFIAEFGPKVEIRPSPSAKSG
jgi:hypothetical protein